MRKISIYVLLALSLWLVACNRSDSSSSMFDSGKLTTEKAQGALSRWVEEGTVTVRGIQELPRENQAKVDVTFSNFKFKLNTQYRVGERNYSGPGTAIFTHYNDGRWVLTKVTTNEGAGSVWWDNVSVEAY